MKRMKSLLIGLKKAGKQEETSSLKNGKETLMNTDQTSTIDRDNKMPFSAVFCRSDRLFCFC